MNDDGNLEAATQDFEGTLAVDVVEREPLDAEQREGMKARIRDSQKLESLGALAGAVAYEFNNFLTGILGNTGMVLRKLPDDSDCRPLVEDVEQAAQHAAALSNQMLAYAGRAAAVRQPLDLKSLVEEMSPLLRISVSKKAVLRLELANGLPVVEGDSSQIRQVIVNLMTNASEALGAGSGHISLKVGILAADREYLVDADCRDGLSEGLYVYIEVSDTGCGVDPVTQANLYEPTFSTKGPGRGMGLAAVHGIVRDHGGAIKLDSTPGRGTTVKVLFAVSDRLPSPEASEQNREDLHDGRGTILVVDDEQIVRDVAGNILDARGYGVLIAENGSKALEVFRRHAGEITAVLLDLTMPELDGAETFIELRRLRPDLPVVLSSGFIDNDSAIELCMTQEAVSFIQKPYSEEQLVERVRAVTRA